MSTRLSGNGFSCTTAGGQKGLEFIPQGRDAMSRHVGPHPGFVLCSCLTSASSLFVTPRFSPPCDLKDRWKHRQHIACGSPRGAETDRQELGVVSRFVSDPDLAIAGTAAARGMLTRRVAHGIQFQRTGMRAVELGFAHRGDTDAGGGNVGRARSVLTRWRLMPQTEY
jgi:hypothetical protein